MNKQYIALSSSLELGYQVFDYSYQKQEAHCLKLMKPNLTRYEVNKQPVSSHLPEIAQRHTPKGSNVQATLDQWLYAIKYDTDLYCDTNICSSKSLKKQVLALTSDAELEKLSNLTINHKFKFIDLFAGIGGIRLGAERNGGLCVFSSEFDKFAQQTYQLNHHEMPFGDITQIDANNLPSHDLLLAGFPCQPFSYSGKTKGFEDKRDLIF